MNNREIYQITLDDTHITFGFDEKEITNQLEEVKTSIVNKNKTKSKNETKKKGSHRPVYPLKDIDTIQMVKEYFLTRPERYKGTNILRYTLFCFGINQVLRVSDICQISIDDVVNPDGTIKDYLIVYQEQKTNKRNVIKLNNSIKEVLVPYLEYRKREGTYSTDNYLFLSRNNTPMTRYSVWSYMKEAEEQLSLEFPLGSHSLRKTCAYHMWENGTDVYTVSNALNHSSLKDTKRYLMINEDEIGVAYDNNCL